MTLIIEPIRKEFSAEVSGIDLSQPTTATIKQQLNSALAQYAVLIFRQQKLTPPQFMAAAEIFGELMDQQLKKYVLPDYPMVGCNSTDDLPRKNGKLQVRGENYHTDRQKRRRCMRYSYLPQVATRNSSMSDKPMTTCLQR